MDGDIAPLPDIYEVATHYDAMLLVDDAHGFGVLGEDGSGTVTHFGLAGDRYYSDGDAQQGQLARSVDI